MEEDIWREKILDSSDTVMNKNISFFHKMALIKHVPKQVFVVKRKHCHPNPLEGISRFGVLYFTHWSS